VKNVFNLTLEITTGYKAYSTELPGFTGPFDVVGLGERKAIVKIASAVPKSYPLGNPA